MRSLLFLALGFSSLCFAENIHYPLDSPKNTPLFKAIAQGNFQKAENLLKNKNRTNKKNVKGATVFHALAITNDEEGSINFLPTLLSYRTDINAQDDNGNTGLAFAIMNGRYRLAQKFLQHNQITINIKNNKGENILHIISEANFKNHHAIRLLNNILSQGSAEFINAQNNKGQTPLHYAVTSDYNDTTFLRALISQDDINVNIKTYLSGAVPILVPLRFISDELYSLQLEKDYSVNRHMISKAIQTIQILLNSSHNINLKIKNNQNNSPYDTVLFIKKSLTELPQDSFYYPYFEPMVEILSLVEAKYNPMNTAFFMAITEGNFQKAKALLEEASTREEGVNSAFMLHALTLTDDEQGSIELFQELLNYKIDINARGENGNTGLTVAIMKGRYQLAQQFLQHNQIDISIKNNKGENILHIFSQANLTDSYAVQILNTILSQEKVDRLINAGDSEENTPLLLALIYNNIELLKILASHPKINLNIPDNKGYAPILIPLTSIANGLYYALHTKNKDKIPTFEQMHNASQAVQILLSYNVNLTIKNIRNTTPYDAIMFIKKSLAELPQDSHLYFAFEPLQEAFSSKTEILNTEEEQTPTDTLEKINLLLAITQGDFKTATALLENKIDPNKKNSMGSTVFHALARYEDEQKSIEFLPTLLKYGADINIQDKYGYTGLAFAIINGRYQLAQKFLQHDNINIYIRTNGGENILHHLFQASFKNLHSIQILNTVLHQGGHLLINNRNIDGKTPLHLAVTLGYSDIELLKVLLFQPEIDVNIPDNNGAVPILIPLRFIVNELYYALRQEKVRTSHVTQIEKASQIIKILLNHKVQLTTKDNKDVSPDDLLLLIKENLPKLAQDSPLYPAFEPLREALLTDDKKEYYPLDSSDNTALFVAIAQGDFQKTQILLEAGVNPKKKSVKGATVFHALSMNDDEQRSIELLPTLLSYELDINTPDEDGNTGLAFAIMQEKYSLAQELLQQNGINIYLANNKGENILHIFSKINLNDPDAHKILDTILYQGGTTLINASNNYGYTTLHLAVIPGNENIKLLKILASHPDTDVNIQDSYGYVPILTPLTTVFDELYNTLVSEENFKPNFQKIYKSSQVIKILLNHSKIDLTINSNQGVSPDSMILTLKEHLSRLSQNSPFYPTFEPLREVLSSH